MLYAITYEIEGISGPGGAIKTSQKDIVDLAKPMAETALYQLDDAVSLGEWYNLEGEDTDPRKILYLDDIDEVINIIGQISDAMKADKVGYIDLHEYEDIFQLIEDQDVTSWCSSSLKDSIAKVRKDYFGLVHELSDEWLDD